MALLPDGFILLNKENYDTWKTDVKVLLIDKDCWKFIEGKEEILEETASRKERNDFELKKNRAFTTLYYAIEPEFRKLVENCTDGKSAWDILNKQFEPKTRARIIQLLDDFFNVRYEAGEAMGIFIARIKSAVKKLKDAGQDMNELFQGFQAIRRLPNEYNGIVQLIYRWEDKEFTIDKIADELVREESRLKQLTADRDSTQTSAFSISSGAIKFSDGKRRSNVKFNARKSKPIIGNHSKSVGPCYRCHKYGHVISQCRENPLELDRNQYRSFRDKESFLIEKYTSTISSTDRNRNIDKYSWVLDTGASTHFCNNKNLFLTFEETDNIHMSLAENKPSSKVLGKGTIKFAVKLNGLTSWIEMDNVLYNPNLRRNLLSGSRLEKAGAHFVGSKGKIWVYQNDWQKLFYAKRDKGLYYLKPFKYKTNERNVEERLYNTSVKSLSHLEDAKLWHSRFCHINYDYICDTGKYEGVNGLPKLQKPKEKCEVCVIAKTSRVSFKSITQRRSTRPLQLVYLDVNGPLPMLSHGGRRYILTIIDDYSRFVTIYILKTKDESFEMFKHYHRQMERMTGKRIIALRTDRGGEFCHRAFNEYLNQHGIKAERTNVYTPEENSVCERFHRTLLDGIKAMLKESELKNEWWAEAAACFTHTWNRTCHKEKRTPFELFMNRKPSVSYFKVFGCKAYVGVPKQKRNKLQMRTKEGIMMGYALETRGYRIWLPQDNKLIETCNVRFNEQKMAADSILGPSHTHERRNFLREDSESESDEEFYEGEPSDDRKDKSDKAETEQFRNPPYQKVTDLKWIRKPKMRPRGDRTDIFYYIEGLNTRFRSHNDIQKFCDAREIEFKEYKNLFDFSPKNNFSGTVSFEQESNEEANISEILIPKSYEEAINSKDSGKWKSAMNDELQMMQDRKVWTLVDKPEGKNILGNRWVFTIKRNERNEIIRYKARLVAHGFRQKRGQDYEDVYSPVVNFAIVRLFFTILVGLLKWTHCLVDIKNAYLYAKLDEELYMSQPKGIIKNEAKVCRLNKAIYGLHQSGRNWFEELERALSKFNFEKLEWCNCAYKGLNTVLLIYVDDIVIFAEEPKYINKVISSLTEIFDLKILGKTKMLLGVEFTEEDGNLYIHQQSYISKVYEKFRKFDVPMKTLPITKGCVLSKLDSPSCGQELEDMENIPFRSLLGCLAFICNRTRPDISYAVNILSQFQENPGMKHWEALLRLLGYVQSKSLTLKGFQMRIMQLTEMTG